MLFVGKSERGYFVEEYAREKGMEFNCIPARTSIYKQVNPILETNCSYVIYDIEQFIDDAEDVAQEIYRIYKANNAKVIIFAPGYLPDATIIQALHRFGFNNFIFAVLMAEMKDQLQKCINGYYDNNPDEQVVAIEVQRSNDRQRTYTTIAVSGSMSRIGTTTQAMQMCKYLLYKGHRVCYIEANQSGYVHKIRDFDTDAKYDEITEKVTFKSIDMFDNMQRIHEYLKMEYDYYVYDFGAWNDKEFFATSYLEKDIKVIVGGAKANEILHMTEVLRVASRWDVYYVFSFIADENQKEILELMEEQAKYTYFAKYVPDLWQWVPADYFSQICPCENLVPETKKHRFFKKGKVK